MASKFLIADDSQTIQKVIKITLSSEDYELRECLSENDLQKNLSEFYPDIVLLDFNLSENKTGYDLVREIKTELPEAKVLVLFGTFDNIEQDLLDQVGANAHIVKPFDGNKFINICHTLVEELGIESSTTIEIEEEIPNVISIDTTDEIPAPIHTEDVQVDEWVVNQPEVNDVEEVEIKLDEEKEDFLKKTLKDWSSIDGPDDIPQPPAIETEVEEVKEFSTGIEELPPVIKASLESIDLEEEVSLPKIDLSIMDTANELEIDLKSQFANLEDTDELPEIEVEDKDPSYVPDDFPTEVKLNHSGAEVVAKDDIEQIVRKILRELLEERFDNEIKNIAWEVIPDLAENLIQKELKSIRSELSD